LKKRNILITGGAGNLGGSLANRLTENDQNQVVILDNLSTGCTNKLPTSTRDNWTFIKADANNASDVAQVMTSYRFDYVFHYAAIVGVQRTLEHPVAVLNDVDGIRNVLNGAKNTGVSRVFFSSSSEVYGEPVVFPQNEKTTPLNSKLPYAIIKNLGESFCRSYYQEYGLQYNIFRFFNTYGPKQSTDFVIPRFIHAALNGQDISIYGDGSQTRTFCYVDDNLDVVTGVLDSDQWTNQVINIGNDVETSVLELAKLIIEMTNSTSRIMHQPKLPEGDMTRRHPDITIMRSILNREPTPLRDGLEKTITSFQKANR
jgi:UDP-glucuronate decarboxylase